jgi:hypothetical protein
VIVEAGIAIGAASRKTILVKLGPVRSMSDLAGVSFVDLDHPRAKEVLGHAMARRLPSPPLTDAMRSPLTAPGDFNRCRRRRWDYHDELGELEGKLRQVGVHRSQKTLFDALTAYTVTNPEPRDWNCIQLTAKNARHPHPRNLGRGSVNRRVAGSNPA